MLHRVTRKVLSSPFSGSSRHFQGSALAAARILATDGVDEVEEASPPLSTSLN